MRLTWRQRLEREPSLRNIVNWPVIPVDSLPRRHRKWFLRNQQIVAEALAGTPHAAVARHHAVSSGRVTQLLARCLGGEEDEPAQLAAGLVPHLVIGARRRRGALPTLGKPAGSACAFEGLLDALPSLREGLDTMIRAKLKDAPYAQRLSPQAFHGEFKRILADHHWPRDRYPYTTESLAYQSVRRHLEQRVMEIQQEREQGKVRAVRPLGTPGRRARAQRAAQIDEHVLDLTDRIHLVLNDELIPLRLGRANVLVTVDVDSTCVLGYNLVPTRNPNQEDLLTLIDNCVQPWKPMALTTPELSYTPGARFPSGLDEAFPISFGMVQLDNALMHHAHSVRDVLCEQMGATLSFGPPGMPKIRYLVESVFEYIGQTLTHQVASTTGSSPADPVKESRKNLKSPPMISFWVLNEALSVILTKYNITPQDSLGGASPLDLFRHHCASHFVRYVPQVLSQHWHPLMGSKVVRLHWYRDEHRAPHVNFFHARYDGPGLASAAGTHKHIRVTFYRPNIRTLHAYTLTGEDLGELRVSASWQRFPHSLATRQWIHKNTRRLRLNALDPLASTFHYMLEHRELPAAALDLLRVYTEFTAGQSGPLVLDNPSMPPTRPTVRHHVWHPGMADHRE